MKVTHSIRFKLLTSILVVSIVGLFFLAHIAIRVGETQLQATFNGFTDEHGNFVKGSRDTIMDNTKRWATILSRLIFGSLRESMAKYDVEAMQKIVRMARAQQDIKAVRVFNPDGKVRFNGDTPELPKEVDNIDCSACHNPRMELKAGQSLRAEMADAEARVDSKLVQKDLKGERSFQMIIHVYNQDDPCWQCHKASQKVNGVLQVNVSLKDVDDMLAKMERNVNANQRLLTNRIRIWGFVFTMVVSAVLLWIATNIVSKLAKFRTIAERISLGESDVTLEDIPVSQDEIGELRDSFERMLVAIKFFMMPEEDAPEENL